MEKKYTCVKIEINMSIDKVKNILSEFLELMNKNVILSMDYRQFLMSAFGLHMITENIRESNLIPGVIYHISKNEIEKCISKLLPVFSDLQKTIMILTIWYYESENQCSQPLKEERSVVYDSVSNPAHYTSGRKFELRKVIEDWDLNFYLGNALKYISRAGRKSSAIEDLKKAKQYIDFEIERIEGAQND